MEAFPVFQKNIIFFVGESGAKTNDSTIVESGIFSTF